MKKLCYLFSINTAAKQTIWQGQILLFNLIHNLNIDPSNICCVVYNQTDSLIKNLSLFSNTLNIVHGSDYSINIWRKYTQDNVDFISYGPLNKSCSVAEFYKSGLWRNFENFILIDADSFYFDKVDYSSFYDRTVLAYAPFIRLSEIFKEEISAIKIDVWGQEYKGINLIKLFEAINIPKNNIDLLIDGGTHHLFMPCRLITNKFVNDLNNWSIVCKTLSYIQGGNSWIPDMVTYALSLACNNIKYEISNDKEMSYSSIEKNGIVHYGFFYPFPNSRQFTKGNYYNTISLLEESDNQIQNYINNSKSEVETYFFNMVKDAKNFYKI